MGVFRYLTHPQVDIDPDQEPRTWPLSQLGRDRVRALCDAPALADTRRILTSNEVKSLQTAQILGDALGITPEIIAETHEIDRTATGFLQDEEWAQTRRLFFEVPERSARGWESAADAQERIVSNVFLAIMMAGTSQDTLCIGHGTVGTLLLCHLLQSDITQKLEQPDGGGNLFAFDMQSDEVLHSWTDIETFVGLTGAII